MFQKDYFSMETRYYHVLGTIFSPFKPSSEPLLEHRKYSARANTKQFASFMTIVGFPIPH